MSRDDRRKALEESEANSARLRDRLGLQPSQAEVERVKDWMSGRGSILVTLAVAAVVVYLIATLILNLR